MNAGTGQSRIAGIFRQHPALLLTALYFGASMIGMLFSFAYFSEFGINYFHYAQVGDFLLASLREPMTWVVVAFSVLLMIGDNASSRWWQRKPRSKWTRWYGSPRYRSVNLALTLVLVALFIVYFAQLQANAVRAGEGAVVELTLADGRQPLRRTFLGTTSQFLFVFDRQSGQVTIHPHENVLALALASP